MYEPGQPSHYELLGVVETASTAEIRTAFRVLAKTAHPDAGGDPAAFRRLKEAHDCLVDARARTAYDASLGVGRPVITRHRYVEEGWRGMEGDFTGSVGWPAWLEGLVEQPWRPDGATPSDTGPRAPRTWRGAVPAWRWAGGADRDPLSLGLAVVFTAGRELAVCEAEAGFELWRADLGAPAAAGPVAWDGLVVAVSEQADVQAFAVANGVLRWQRRFKEQPTTVAATADAIVITVGPRVVGLDPETGEQRWSTRIGGHGVESTGVENLAVVRTDRRTIEGIEAARGRRRFAHRDAPDLLVPPVGSAGLVWLVRTDGRFVALDPLNGTALFAVAPGITTCGVCTDGSRSLLWATVAGPSEIVALSSQGGVAWRAALPCAAVGPAVDHERVFVVTGEQHFLTYDRATGDLLTSSAVGVRPVGDLVAVVGKVLVRDREGTVWAYAPHDLTP